MASKSRNVDQMSLMLAGIQRLESSMTQVQTRLGAVESKLVEVEVKLDAQGKRLNAVRDRVSDIDAASRSAARARHVTGRYVSEASPTGGAFSEHESEYGPPSIFSQ